MNIVWLCKRHYTNHDVIQDQYARLYEIPRWLGCYGNQIHAFCLSYKRSSQGILLENDQVLWRSSNALPHLFTNYTRSLIRQLDGAKIDVIVGSSDLLHIVVAWRLAKTLNVPFVADLYDNYESFGMANIPFLGFLYRQALRNAHHVFTVSDPLNNYIHQTVGHDQVTTIENAVNPGQFFRKNREEARSVLNLNFDAEHIYVGLSGGLSIKKGVDIFLKGFRLARQQNRRLKLVLAGNLDPGLPVPALDTTYLGILKYDSMNDFYNAMSINAVSLVPNNFGRFAFPQKAYEIAAAGSHCIVPNFGSMVKFIDDFQWHSYIPGDEFSICNTLQIAASCSNNLNIQTPTWREQAEKVYAVLKEIISKTRE